MQLKKRLKTEIMSDSSTNYPKVSAFFSILLNTENKQQKQISEMQYVNTLSHLFADFTSNHLDGLL